MKSIPAILLVCLLAMSHIASAHSESAQAQGNSPWPTFNVERVGWNGEVGKLPGGLTEIQVQGDYAYLGTFLSDEGMLIVDVSDPTAPVLVGNFPLEDARVADIKVNAKGTIAVLSNEPNAIGSLITFGDSDNPANYFNGVTLVDISDKTNPQLLSRLAITNEAGQPDGIHNIAIHGDFVYLAPDSPEVADTPIGMIVLDISDPGNPVEVTRTFAPNPEDLGFSSTDASPEVHLHDITIHATAEGEVYAVLSFWDAGILIYDVTTPSEPQLVSEWRGLSPDVLNAHYTKISPDGSLMVLGGEFPSGFTGFLTFLDVRDIRQPKLITTWSRPGPQWLPPEFPLPLIWTYHNFSFSPDSKRLYIGLYSAGMWVLNLENPAQPQVIGTYGPDSFETVFEGLGVFPTTPFVWAAEVQDDLIYVSDFNSGLYILRLTEHAIADGLGHNQQESVAGLSHMANQTTDSWILSFVGLSSLLWFRWRRRRR